MCVSVKALSIVSHLCAGEIKEKNNVCAYLCHNEVRACVCVCAYKGIYHCVITPCGYFPTHLFEAVHHNMNFGCHMFNVYFQTAFPVHSYSGQCTTHDVIHSNTVDNGEDCFCKSQQRRGSSLFNPLSGTH